MHNLENCEHLQPRSCISQWYFPLSLYKMFRCWFSFAKKVGRTVIKAESKMQSLSMKVTKRSPINSCSACAVFPQLIPYAETNSESVLRKFCSNMQLKWALELITGSIYGRFYKSDRQSPKLSEQDFTQAISPIHSNLDSFNSSPWHFSATN